MEEAFRVSVRELVAFSYYPEDIMPSADVRDMLAGGQAHRARQKKQQGEAERTVSQLFAFDGEQVLVFGRMDAFTDGEVPFVEEIKLSANPGDAPLLEHRAQALCYAAMIAAEKGCEQVQMSVVYVDINGEVLRAFPETLSKADLLGGINALLAPYVAFAKRERAHKTKRDETLKELRFPFESYRKGQRELAAQVYTAIVRKKRLFAGLPTGTGKSAAVLYPALKALGEGKTVKLLYLTARNTARQSPLNALERMHADGMHARVTVLTAKEKLCPNFVRCHPDVCPRAKGHYLREGAAVDELLHMDVPYFSDELIKAVAQKHELCPFELALRLTELADVVLLDMNYAFDPFAQLKRLFQRVRGMTLLIDEAHHVVERVRESLSGTMDSRELARIRAAFGKAAGRKHPFYTALSSTIRTLRDLAPSKSTADEADEANAEAAQAERAPLERTLTEIPDGLIACVQRLLEAAQATFANPVAGEAMRYVGETTTLCLPFLYAAEHLDEDYAILSEAHGKEHAITLYCLLPAKHIAQVTKTMRGSVFFSATLTPLPAMKSLLGGTEEDACFSLPSPFQAEHLAVVRRRVDTRYAKREASAALVAQSITQAVRLRPGKYIAYFPSYAYMRLVLNELNEAELPPLWVQRRGMDEDERTAFFNAFDVDDGAKLGLCVLGGLYSEGVDLPGDRLVGAIVVGVGLPIPTQRLKAIQTCYQRHFGDGFTYACLIPAMHKVLQAGGRIIRTEQDKGLLLLLDERYYQWEYVRLLPPEWQLQNEDIEHAIAKLEE